MDLYEVVSVGFVMSECVLEAGYVLKQKRKKKAHVIHYLICDIKSLLR